MRRILLCIILALWPVIQLMPQGIPGPGVLTSVHTISGGGLPTFSQSANGAGGSITVSATTIGQLIAVGQIATSATQTAPTDNKSNTYTQIFSQTSCNGGTGSSGGTLHCSNWYTYDAAGGVTTISTPSANISVALVFTGTTAIDQNSSVSFNIHWTGTGPFTITGPSVVTGHANEILVTWLDSNSSASQTGTGGWTIPANGQSSGAQSYILAMGYLIEASAGTYAYTATNTGGFNADVQTASFF